MTKTEELLESLVRNKIISFNQLTETRESASRLNKTEEEILVEKGIIDIEELAKLRAAIYGLAYFSLDNKKIKNECLQTIPEEASENYKIICFDKDEQNIKIGMVNPDNFKAVEVGDFISKKAGLRAVYYLISEVSFKAGYKQYQGLSEEVKTALDIKEQEDDTKEKVRLEAEGLEFEEVIKSAPVAKIVTVIMRHAVEGRASDIHIEPLQHETRVRYRIDGILNTSLTLPKHVHNSIVGRIKVLANLKLDETRIPQDGRIRESFNNKEIDFRISILPLLNDEKVVMRILDISKGAPKLEDLGFMGLGLNIIKKNIKKTNGMLLVTGPTGSGKSTTLFSILNKINREGVNISTLEDPVEYFIKGVNQAQVRPEVGFTFASGLRSLLRQDPDIIMVGEIRDAETAELAVHASLTGHFVLSTLHTNDALGAIPRLMDMKVEPFLLSSTLNTIVAQRLVRKICENCKQEVKLQKDILDDFVKNFENVSDEIIKSEVGEINKDNLVIYKGAGCPRCGNTGYNGRVAIAEVLNISDFIIDAILNGKVKNLTTKEIKTHQKFISLSEDGVIKVLRGLTTYEEVLRVFMD